MGKFDIDHPDITPASLRYSQADAFTPPNALYGPTGADIVSSTGVPTVGDLYAFPYWNPLQGVLDQIGFNVTVVGGAGSVARCGLYESASRVDGEASDRFLVPGNLVVDGGEQITDAGAVAKMTALSNVRLNARTMYWLVFMCGVAAPTVTTFTSGWHLFGRNSNFNAQFGWQKVGFGYKALPAVFPFSPQPGIATSTAALVVVRYASYDRFMRSGA